MKAILRLVLAGWCGVLITPAFATTPTTTVTVSGYNVLINGSKFAFKGANYSPVPIGTDNSQAPYGDFFVSAYSAIWTADLAAMRAAGVNCIKLYAGNPSLNAGAAGTAGNWKPFLDACYNGGTNPIYVFMTSYIPEGDLINGGAGLTTDVANWTALVASTVTHPAVIGYVVGNESFGGQTDSTSSFWMNYGSILTAAQAAGVAQGVDPFLITATDDDYEGGTSNAWTSISTAEASGQVGDLDAWGINVYRGDSFGGSGNLVFPQYLGQMTTLGIVKPLIITEFGTPHSTRDVADYGQNTLTGLIDLDSLTAAQLAAAPYTPNAQPVGTFLTSEWNTMLANLDGSNGTQVAVGGFIFEWTDEYWKGNDDNNHVAGPATSYDGNAYAGGYDDEAWFGLQSAVNLSLYTSNSAPNRTSFDALASVTTAYTASTWSGSELYAAPPTVAVPAPQPPALKLKGARRIVTSASQKRLSGVATSDDVIKAVYVDTGKGKPDKAKGTAKWHYLAKLSPGRNRFRIQVVDVHGRKSARETVTIIYKP